MSDQKKTMRELLEEVKLNSQKVTEQQNVPFLQRPLKNVKNWLGIKDEPPSDSTTTTPVARSSGSAIAAPTQKPKVDTDTAFAASDSKPDAQTTNRAALNLSSSRPEAPASARPATTTSAPAPTRPNAPAPAAASTEKKETPQTFGQAFKTAREKATAAGNPSTGSFQFTNPKTGETKTYQTNIKGEKYVAPSKQTATDRPALAPQRPSTPSGSSETRKAEGAKLASQPEPGYKGAGSEPLTGASSVRGAPDTASSFNAGSGPSTPSTKTDTDKALDRVTSRSNLEPGYSGKSGESFKKEVDSVRSINPNLTKDTPPTLTKAVADGGAMASLPARTSIQNFDRTRTLDRTRPRDYFNNATPSINTSDSLRPSYAWETPKDKAVLDSQKERERKKGENNIDGFTPPDTKKEETKMTSPMIEAFLKLHKTETNNLFTEAKKHKKLDPVGKEDEDIDNDGDSDKSDKYLHNRRKAISSAIKEEEKRSSDPDMAAPKDPRSPKYKDEIEPKTEMPKNPPMPPKRPAMKEDVEFSEEELAHFASILEMPIAPVADDYSGSKDGPSKRDLSDETIIETKKKDPSELKTRGRKAGVKVGAYKMKGMDDVAGDEAKAEPKNLVAQNPRTYSKEGKNLVDLEHPSQSGVKRTVPAKEYNSFRSNYLNAEKPEHKTKMHDDYVKRVFN